MELCLLRATMAKLQNKTYESHRDPEALACMAGDAIKELAADRPHVLAGMEPER
jgi:hypothetical protein